LKKKPISKDNEKKIRHVRPKALKLCTKLELELRKINISKPLPRTPHKMAADDPIMESKVTRVEE